MWLFHSKKKLHSLKDRFLNEMIKFGKFTLDTSVGSMEWFPVTVAPVESRRQWSRNECVWRPLLQRSYRCVHMKELNRNQNDKIFVQHRNEYWSSIGPPNFWFLPRNEVFADLNPQNLRCTLARRNRKHGNKFKGIMSLHFIPFLSPSWVKRVRKTECKLKTRTGDNEV